MYTNSSGRTRFNIDYLCSNPLLESIYAETLRLRIAAFIMRSPERDSIKANQWIFPKRSIVLVATTPAHMDEKIWNTGDGNQYPLERFWAERFLVYPNDPTSGPTRTNQQSKAGRSPASNGPSFSVEGLGGSWIPYGGGYRACPGRHFAKREILMTLAVMVTMFDIELDAKMNRTIDPRANGLGAQRPLARIPFRIRRREASYHF